MFFFRLPIIRSKSCAMSRVLTPTMTFERSNISYGKNTILLSCIIENEEIPRRHFNRKNCCEKFKTDLLMINHNARRYGFCLPRRTR